MNIENKAVILFSGGLDSTTCLALAKAEGYECYVWSVDYGQKHRVELERAKQLAALYQVKQHKIIAFPLGTLSGSALTDAEIKVENYQGNNDIPNTYVPARNTIFLALALGWAETIQATHIFIGANIVDYSQYPDCRPDYLQAFETMANLATKAGREGKHITIHAPLLNLSKAEIIQLGETLGVDYSLTISCYRPSSDGLACGQCDSCVYRKKGFQEAKVSDPTRYIAE